MILLPSRAEAAQPGERPLYPQRSTLQTASAPEALLRKPPQKACRAGRAKSIEACRVRQNGVSKKDVTLAHREAGERAGCPAGGPRRHWRPWEAGTARSSCAFPRLACNS